MPTKADSKKSKKDRLREEIQGSVAAAISRPRPAEGFPDSHDIDRRNVRRALKRNRLYGDIALDLIEPDPNQPRTVRTQTEEFRDLVDSVKSHGVIQPITVRWIEDREKFWIVTGERRFRASLAAGLHTIPAVLKELDDAATATLQLVENVQRENMNPVEEARALQAILVTTGVTHAELARRVGKSRSYVTEMLSLPEKLTKPEQDELARRRPADVPGKSLILAALRATDPKTRAAILRGEMTRRQARTATKKSTGGRPRHATRTYVLDELDASVTVRFKKRTASRDDVLAALRAAERAARDRQ